jgi:hypothetical protein
MSKMTLLTLTQRILSSMDSDDVNSIDDTEESIQVSDMIEDSYFEIVAGMELPHLEQLCQMESIGDDTKPTHLRVPVNVDKIDTIKYEQIAIGTTPRSFPELMYKTPEDFINDSYNMTLTDANVFEVVENGVSIFIKTNSQPKYWTSFDDEFIVLDSYDKLVESTAQGIKTTVSCRVLPAWTRADTFTPDLPAKMFPLLLAESKNACHFYLKQQQSSIDGKRAVRGYNKMRRDAWRTHDQISRPKFGRK